jgi:hypothetical protein
MRQKIAVVWHTCSLATRIWRTLFKSMVRSALSLLCQGGQQHGGEDGYDGNDHEKFDESECRGSFGMVRVTFHRCFVKFLRLNFGQFSSALRYAERMILFIANQARFVTVKFKKNFELFRHFENTKVCQDLRVWLGI